MPRRNSSTPRRNSTSSKSSKTSKESSKKEESVSTTVVEETRVVNEQESEIRQSRVQEKHQLHNLNDRLQNFVLHSKAMEEENADLRRQLRDMEERMKESLQEVHQEYSKQSKKLRTYVLAYRQAAPRAFPPTTWSIQAPETRAARCIATLTGCVVSVRFSVCDCARPPHALIQIRHHHDRQEQRPGERERAPAG